MARAKCFRCGASAEAETFEQAKNKLDHAIGLSRGINCGASFDTVSEIKNNKVVSTVKNIPTESKPTEPKKIVTEKPKKSKKSTLIEE